jgi:hypothetical protein
VSSQKWTGYCDHSGEACECGMEIITPLRAKVKDLERVLEHTVLGRDRALARVEELERELDGEGQR